MGNGNSIFGYIGGKRKLRARIAKFIPEQDVSPKERRLKYFIDCFGGAGWVSLYKEKWFETDVYNDLNGSLVNLFRVIKYHPDEFARQFDFLLVSKEEFDFLLQNDQETDIKKAVATYYKYAYSFSSNGESFAIKVGNKDRLFDNIHKLHKRFQNIVITNFSYEKAIDRFNRKNCFLYLDPPYFDKEYLYEIKFRNEDHLRLHQKLNNFEGKFALSYNDHPEIRKLYQDFNIVELSTTYSCFGKSDKTNELLIMNY